MRNAGLEETKAGIKVAGRNINNLRYADGDHGKTVKEYNFQTRLRREGWNNKSRQSFQDLASKQSEKSKNRKTGT